MYELDDNRGSDTKYHDTVASSPASSPGQQERVVESDKIIAALHIIVDAACQSATPTEREIIRDNVTVAVYEGAASRRLRNVLLDYKHEIDDLPEPVPDITAEKVAEIMRVGKAHPWSERRDDDKKTSVDWVRKYYISFVPGILTEHLTASDPDLSTAFLKHVSRKGLPGGLDIPTRADNELRKLPPIERQALKISRERSAVRTRAYRAGKNDPT